MKKMLDNKLFLLSIEIVCSILIAACVELICGAIITLLSPSFFQGFNFARFWFFFGAFLSIVLIYNIFKENIKKIETIFLAISLIVGSVMILSSPFGHISWDLESHFTSIMSYASFDGQVTGAEEFICEDGAGSLFKHGYENNQKFIQETNVKDSTTVNKTYDTYLISHIPGAIIYDITKIAGLPFNIRLDLIRFCYLILYSIICYFAIKKLNTSKLIFATIGLLPTCLFIASNITYDWWIISFTMLGISYFYSEYQQPTKRMKIREILIMMGSLFLGCYIKAVYFLLLFVPLFMKKDYFKKDKIEMFKYYSIVLIFLFLLFAVFMFSFFAISPQGDDRGGSNVNPSEQLAFILLNPVKYLFILGNFITQYLSLSNLVNLTSSFAHLTTGGRLVVARDFGFFIIILVVVTIIDRNNYDKLSTTWKFKILSCLAFIVSTVLIITALYISFNNVGSLVISGVQARYLIPLLPMVLPTLGFVNKYHDKTWPTKYVKLGYTVIMCSLLYWDIGHVMLLQLL